MSVIPSSVKELARHTSAEFKEVAKHTAAELNIHGAVTALVLILKHFANEEIILISFFGCSFVVSTHLHFRQKRKEIRVNQVKKKEVWIVKNF